MLRDALECLSAFIYPAHYKLNKEVSMTSKWVSELLYRIRLMLIGEESQEEDGQGLVEYALIIIIVSLTVLILVSMLGPDIGNIFSNIVSHL
jgi:pilus assembly protein Flp/PilA